MRLELAVELVKDDARLDKAAASLDMEFEYPVQMLAGVDDDGMVDRLPALRCAAAARQHGDALLAREIKRRLDIAQRLGNHHRMRHHLIDGCVRSMTAAGERIVHHRALETGPQRGE